MEWNEFNQKMKDLSPDYMSHRRATRQQMYRNYIRNYEVHTHTINIPKVGAATPSNWLTFSLAPLQEAECNPDSYGFKQEGITPMNYASASVTTAPTETETQRKYLEKRLYEVYHDKREPLEAKFGLTDDPYPQDGKDLAQRIKDGKFIIRGVDTDEQIPSYYGTYDLIRWRDPAKKADQEGFDAAKADLKEKRQAALDTIKIDDVKAGLEAVKSLETWEPTGAAN